PAYHGRVSLIIPAFLCFTVGLCDYFFTDDCPQGDWLKRGLPPNKLPKKTDTDDANKIVTDTDSEMNVLVPTDAGLIASLFGLMNLFSHASGGFLSDIGNEKMGIHVQLKRGGGSIGDAVFAAVFKKFPQSSMSFTILGIL
ncbi:4278_t:CDS:2, partial [Rhizophagus irregularis]